MLQRRPALQPRPATRSAALPCNPGPPPAAQPCPATHAPARSAPCPPAWPARPACPAPGPRWRRSEQQLAARPRMPSTPSLLPYWPTCTRGCGWGGRQACWASAGWQGLLSRRHIRLRAKVCQADSPAPFTEAPQQAWHPARPPHFPASLASSPTLEASSPARPAPAPLLPCVELLREVLGHQRHGNGAPGQVAIARPRRRRLRHLWPNNGRASCKRGWGWCVPITTLWTPVRQRQTASSRRGQQPAARAAPQHADHQLAPSPRRPLLAL